MNRAWNAQAEVFARWAFAFARQNLLRFAPSIHFYLFNLLFLQLTILQLTLNEFKSNIQEEFAKRDLKLNAR